MRTTQSLDIYCPKVAGIKEDKKEAAICAAMQKVYSLSLRKNDEEEAIFFYAGYLLSLSLVDAPAGVSSEKEGDLARTYGSKEQLKDPFGYLSCFNDIVAKNDRDKSSKISFSPIFRS